MLTRPRSSRLYSANIPQPSTLCHHAQAGEGAGVQYHPAALSSCVAGCRRLRHAVLLGTGQRVHIAGPVCSRARGSVEQRSPAGRGTGLPLSCEQLPVQPSASLKVAPAVQQPILLRLTEPALVTHGWMVHPSRLHACRADGAALSRTSSLTAAKQQAAEDAALQTAIMLSLADAGHTAAASAVAHAASRGSVKRRQTPECVSRSNVLWAPCR